MGTCNKADGSGAVVLRNSTTLVMHMKVYDESIQLGMKWAWVWWAEGVCSGRDEGWQRGCIAMTVSNLQNCSQWVRGQREGLAPLM